ncbi:MAG: hydrolase [Methylobacter sp.]|nr:MAG: hydrolase [Methylobacter sp.]
MQRYIFLDLDDTLFQTLRKCPDASDPRLQVRACLPDGTPNSYATVKQQWLWDWFNQGFRIVPVTARDMDAYRRVVGLTFQEEQIINHGGVILDKHGGIDPVWMEKMTQALLLYQPAFNRIWADIEAFCAQDDRYNVRLAQDLGITWYGYIKHQGGTEAALAGLLAMVKTHPAVQDGSVYWHINGNNLAVLPKTVNKENAVAYLLAKYHQDHSEVLSFGVGDSKTDAPFLALCDYALIPKGTQLHQKLAGQ